MEKKTARVSMKRLLGILLIVFSVIMMAFPMVPDVDASAKTKKKSKTETIEGQDGDLKNLNITWDIKKGKTVKAKTNYNVVGERKFKIKMTKYKVKNLKKGKKKITFTMKYSNLAPNITVEQGEKIYYDYYNNGVPAGGAFFLSVVDSKTGLSLEKANPKVTVASDGFNCSDYKYTYLFGSSPDEEDQSWYIYYPNAATITVTVTCSKDTEGIVILAGGIKHPEIDNTPFYNGEIKFSESALYVPDDKSYVHAMEIKLSDTATPEPTATPVPTATATPEPTATPAPTATPKPTGSHLYFEEEKAVAEEMLETLTETATTYGWTIIEIRPLECDGVYDPSGYGFYFHLVLEEDYYGDKRDIDGMILARYGSGSTSNEIIRFWMKRWYDLPESDIYYSAFRRAHTFDELLEKEIIFWSPLDD